MRQASCPPNHARGFVHTATNDSIEVACHTSNTMTNMPSDRIAQSLDESELWSKTATDQLLSQPEYGKKFRGLSTREQKRWRRKIETRLWRLFKQEVALEEGAVFTVRDVSEAVIDDVKLWLDREWATRRVTKRPGESSDGS